MKRILILSLTLLLLLSVTLLGVAAEEESDPSVPGDSASAVSPDAEEVLSTPDETRSFGDTVNYIWDTYADEIFSGLTLIISLVLAYFYKRGLLPVVWNGLDRLQRASAEAQDSAKVLIAASDEKLTQFIAHAEPILNGMETANAAVTALLSYIGDLETKLEQCDHERVLTQEVMRGVADMLYGVFTAANLPTYAKEQIGARYSAITAAIRASGGADEEQETPDL